MRVLSALLWCVAGLLAQDKTPLPDGALRRLGENRFRTDEAIYCTALSADGKLVAAGTTTRLQHPWVDVFDTSTGKRLWHFPAYGHVVRGLAFAPDGQTLVASNGDGALTLYDLATGRERWRAKDTGSDAVLFLGDGTTLASANGPTVALLDVATGRVQRELKHHKKRIHVLALTDKGDQLAVGAEDSEVSVWNVAKGERTHTFIVPKYALGLAFHPAGTSLAAAGFGGDCTCFDLPNNKQLWHAKAVAPTEVGGPITFSATGQQVYSLRGRGVIYDATNGTVIGEKAWGTTHHQGAVSRERTLFAPVRSDQTVRLLNLSTGRYLHEIAGHTYSPSAIAFAEGGKSLFTLSRDGLLRWDETDRPTLQTLAAVGQMKCSPDGTKIVTLCAPTSELLVWDVVAKKVSYRVVVGRSTFDGLTMAAQQLHCTRTGIYVSIAGHHYGVARYGYTAKDKDNVWRTKRDGRDSPLALGGLLPAGFAVTPDERHVLMAEVSVEGAPKLVRWDTATNKEERAWKIGPPIARFRGELSSTITPESRDTRSTPAVPLGFLPNGSAYVGESEAGLLLLRADNSERVRVLCSRDELSKSYAIVNGGFVSERVPWAMSPDGRLVVVGRDKGIHLIETATGVRRRSFDPNSRLVALTFAPEGTRFASCGELCTPFVWDVYAAPPSIAPTRAECFTLLESTKDTDVQRVLHFLRGEPATLLELARAVKPHTRDNAGQVRAWLRDLDDDRYATREAAQKALAALESDWLAVIDAHSKDNKLSEEAQLRIAKVRTALHAETLTAAQRRETRLLELLERLATPDARREIERLATGDTNCWLTRQAQETLARLKQQ